jgi:branched-chain amino acid transport system substrate-binding protein
MLKKKTIFILLTVLTLCIAGFLLYALSKKEVIYVGIAGPMSGNCESCGKTMLNAASLCLDMFRKEGGLRGKEIKLVPLDDNGDKDIAAQIAESALQKKILLVLGHYDSPASLSAGKVYWMNDIPAITASAADDRITRENNWYFRIIPGNSVQGNFIANYISKSLNKTSASIIFDRESYSNLAESFEKAARRLRIDIKKKWQFDGNAESAGAEIENITAELVSMNDDPGMIFIAAHAAEGAKIVSLLRYPGKDFSVIGPASFANQLFIEELRKYPQERLNPGYYSDEIYAVSPFMTDSAGERAQVFRNEFVNKYGEKPSWIAAGYYDAMFVALQAIQHSGVRGGTYIRTDRRRIRDYLTGLYNPQNAVQGITGDIFFDAAGNIIRPSGVGVYKNQRLISAFSQYQFVPDLRRVRNILQEILEGRIIRVDGKFMNKVRGVYAGIDINEISSADLESGIYTADFYLWFRFEGELDDANIEFVNAVRPIQMGNPVAEEKAGNITARAYHVKGEFKSRFNFRDYPFDRQTLYIRLRHARHTKDELIFISDTLGMRGFDSQTDSRKLNINAVRGWEIRDIFFFPDMADNRSALGMPSFFEFQRTGKYSQFNAAVRMQRISPGFLFKDIVPVIAMLLILYIVYFIHPEQLGTRMMITLTALLTNIFCHLKLLSKFSAEYMLTTEYVFLAGYLLGGTAVLISAAGYTRMKYGNDKNANSPNRIGKILHPSVILITGFLITYRYLS